MRSVLIIIIVLIHVCQKAMGNSFLPNIETDVAISQSSEPDEKLNIEGKILIVNQKELHILYFKKNIIDHIEFNDSKIFGLNLQNKNINYFSANDTIFNGTKASGTKINNCKLKNVVFINSDLSFSNFKKCTQENVKYKNVVSYELSEYFN